MTEQNLMLSTDAVSCAQRREPSNKFRQVPICAAKFTPQSQWQEKCGGVSFAFLLLLELTPVERRRGGLCDMVMHPKELGSPPTLYATDCTTAMLSTFTHSVYSHILTFIHLTFVALLFQPF